MKPITGYNELYSITEEGQVYSHRFNRLLKPKSNGIGYMQLQLVKDKVKKTYYVHRLVGLTLLEGHRPGLVIDHIDNDRANNHPSNLRWITQSQNVQKYYDEGFINKSKKVIQQFTLSGDFVKEHTSLKDAKIELGYTKPGSGSAISMCLKGKRTRAYGYSWKYA